MKKEHKDEDIDEVDDICELIFVIDKDKKIHVDINWKDNKVDTALTLSNLIFNITSGALNIDIIENLSNVTLEDREFVKGVLTSWGAKIEENGFTTKFKSTDPIVSPFETFTGGSK